MSALAPESGEATLASGLPPFGFLAEKLASSVVLSVAPGVGRAAESLAAFSSFSAKSVSPLDSAAAVGAHYPTPTAPSITFTSLCFQQFGESAFRSKLTPIAGKTSHSGTLLAQGAHLRDTNSSKAGVLPKTFWHSWHSSVRLLALNYV
jgi:hypothetical protein